MNSRLVTFCLALGLTLAGCGGGSGTGGSSKLAQSPPPPPSVTPPATEPPPPMDTPPPTVTPPPPETPPPATPPPSTPPPPIAGPWGGHYVGTVKIGDDDYFAEVLLTSDGLIRLYVGGPFPNSGALLETDPSSSALYVGTLNAQGTEASPEGEFIGVDCAAARSVPFCDGPIVNYGMQLTLYDGGIRGSVDVTVNSVRGTWLLDLVTLNTDYLAPANLHSIAGSYTEQIADFSDNGDTVITIDSTGLLFFQSASSGCTGNGTIKPHPDGSADGVIRDPPPLASVNVYDVTLTIANCSPPYEDYNSGTFEGLATTSPSSVWDYDSVLRIWLARQNFHDSWAALMMSGNPQ